MLNDKISSVFHIRYLMLPICCILLTGCMGQDVDRSRSGFENAAVDVSQQDAGPIETASRVDQIHRQLLGANPFLGIEPTVYTVTGAEPEICHPDVHGLFVTVGLVERCSTDDQLAAVLATRLVTMSAEKRTTERIKTTAESAPSVPDRSAGNNGGISSDQNWLGTQLLIEQQRKGSKSDGSSAMNPEETQKRIKEIVISAGFDSKAVAEIQPLLAEAARHDRLIKKLGGRNARPRWTK